MTREGSLFTHSQEEAFLQECGIKDFEDQIDIDPLQFPFPFDNLSQQLVSCEDFTEEQQLPVDDKISLQQTVTMTQQQIQPAVTPILGRDEFAGEYNFQLILNHQNSGKHWVYSEKLSKVFIHMEQVLPLQFQWTPPTDGLWVRATMVYKLDQHRSQPVLRCHNHMAPDNNSNRNIDPRQVKHVIRCLHNTSSYEEATNAHLSVLTPLGTPEAGVHNVPMDFIFYCKNSCTSGMNRRPTELIFTLETDQNQILGRRKLEVRVCSCPKRDKEKEENELDASLSVGSGKKRKLTTAMPGLPPPGKKISADNKVYNLNLNVVGRENVNAIIKYAHDVMAGAAVRTGNYEYYKPYMDEVLWKYQ